MPPPKRANSRPRPQAPDGDQYLTTREAAAELGVSDRTLRTLYKARRLASSRIGLNVWILRSDIRSYLAACRVEAEPAPAAK